MKLGRGATLSRAFNFSCEAGSLVQKCSLALVDGY